jgi:lactobin A/cerein 7B family class IIb bacteriocin
MLQEASGICALTDDELDEVSGGVGLLVTVFVLTGALVAGLAVGTYLKNHDASSGGNKPGDYPAQSNNAATV